MGNGLLDDIFAGANGVASTLIYEFGTSITIQYANTGVVDPLTNTLSGSTSGSFTVDAIPPRPYNKFYVDGTTILATDLQTTTPALTAIEMGYSAVYEDRKYRVINVQPIQSGIEIAAYKLQLRAL